MYAIRSYYGLRGQLLIVGKFVPLAMAGDIPDIETWLGTGEQAKLIIGRADRNNFV